MTPDHEFHALWFYLAGHEPEDVHAHPCIADGHEMSQRSGGCGLVLVGWGRGCQGPFAPHFRAKLDDRASVERAVRQLKESVRASRQTDPLDLSELRRVAEAANAGDRGWTWRASEREESGGYPQCVTREGDAVLVAECFESPDFPSRFAEFIATFDPPTVLLLLDTAATRNAA